MAFTGLLILASGLFLMTLVGIPGVSRRIRGAHYAWIMVGLASVMWMTSSAIRLSTSVLVPYLGDPNGSFGWSYGFIAFGLTLQWVLSGILSPVAGWLGDRYGVRRVMTGGAVLFIAGMMLTGTMAQWWQFWLYFGLVLAAPMAIFHVSLVAGVGIWFKKRLGLAMGLLQASVSLGTAAVIGLTYLLFDQFGLRWTYWLPGIAGGAVLLLGTWFFFDEPAALGQRPYGAENDEPIRKPRDNEAVRLRTRGFLKQAQKTTTFWNLVGIHFWGCVGHSVILLFLVAMAVDAGMSQGMAVGVYVTLMVVTSVTRFAVPVVADHMGSKGAMGVCFCLQTFPVLILLAAHSPWSFFLFAVLFGMGMGGEGTAFPIINRQYYGDAPTGATYGWQVLGANLGMAMGPLAGGMLWDATGGYTASVILSFVTSLVGVISISLLPATSRHQIPLWEEALPPEARVPV